ncbi:MAG: KamA family radical SAM protein [Oligoflexus sp.]
MKDFPRSENIGSAASIQSAAAEFMTLAQQKDIIASYGADLFGISLETFMNWRWQMKHQISNAAEAKRILELSSSEEAGFTELNELFQTGITPYYLSLMKQQISEHGEADCPIRRQALPRQEELQDQMGLKDPLQEVDHSPVREVVHVYPDRVAFCVAQLCPVYCRYCFRKRRDDEVGLHFNRNVVQRGLDYIRSQPAIRDVLITGGDPFIASDSALESLLQQIREIPHVEIIRFGTRTPVTLPYRVTAKLAKIISQFHPVWLNTHFNCVEEITPEAELAVANLVNHGIPVGNQAVLLKGVNDTPKKMLDLCRGLLKIRVRPYYVFHPHYVEGTEHLRVSLRQGMEIMKSLRGNITGFGIPTYALDTPHGKIPIQHNYMLGEDGDDILVETIRGEIWREKGILAP